MHLNPPGRSKAQPSLHPSHGVVPPSLLLARSRAQPSLMYVLDYILERKGVSDLASSIKDNR